MDTPPLGGGKGTEMKLLTRFSRHAAALLLALALSIGLSAPSLAAEPAAAPESGSQPKTLEEAAKEAAEAAMSYGSADSISWAVWQDGTILSTGREPSPGPDAGHLLSLAYETAGNIYGIGSISKIYTTVAVMQLAEAGKLSLDKPVTTYLPSFKMADERYKDITVRMLLNHSSGLMGSSFGSALLFDDPSTYAADVLLERLAGQRLKADPGAYSTYCNDGFSLAELVVEAVSGQDFMDYVKANILKPLKANSTYSPADAPFNYAATYSTDSDGNKRALPMDCIGAVGAGGLYASAEDLAAFGGALTGKTLLNQSSLEAMAAPEYAKGIWPEDTLGALSFGLGWDSVSWFPFSQNGIQALVKGGDTQYYHAGLVIIPEYKLAAAVLSSGGVSTYNEMAASQMLVNVLEGQGVTIDQTVPTLPKASPASMPKELMDFAGYYGSLMQYKVDVAPNGSLTMSYLSNPDAPTQVFTYHSDGTFRDKTGTAYLKFVKESNGQIYLYQKAFSDLPLLGGLPTSDYAAVKLPENNVSSDVQSAWDSFMSGTNLLPLNERYSSQVYFAISLAGTTYDGKIENVPGYAAGLRIQDENKALYNVQIPGNAGRDGSDLELRQDEKGNRLVYQSNGGIYIDASSVPNLSAGKNSRTAATIQPDGYARWYHIGENTAGKTMGVELPENSAFWVYDKEGKLTASSVLWNDQSAQLPAEGFIAFAGSPGAKFQLSFS